MSKTPTGFKRVLAGESFKDAAKLRSSSSTPKTPQQSQTGAAAMRPSSGK